ncbi:MAG TPA: hypothetical protein DCE70_07055 [Acinetobacter sp.]|nr:hypothetical protein [Acinetobacter sp.]
MNTKVDEGKLISGKEALIALCDGLKVEYRMKGASNWGNDQKTIYLNLNNFMTGQYEFRLKPRTILINGIEVPACGVDYKPHTFIFVLNSLEPCEYSKIMLDESDEIPPYWWSTEDEIKQVVAALRQVFGGSHDN